jgi:hypothetical protein
MSLNPRVSRAFPTHVVPVAFLLILSILAIIVATPPEARAADGNLQDGSADGFMNSRGSKWQEFDFDVTQSGILTVELNWTNAGANLNLFLRHPNGNFVAMETSSSTRPEQITWAADTTGTWGIGVKAKSGSSNFTVTANLVTSSPGGDSDLQDGTASGFLNASGDKWAEHAYQVDQAGTLALELNWTNAGADFNLFLRKPNGEWAKQETGSSNRPEKITWNVTTGEWGVGVKAKSGSSSYTVAADFSPDGTSGSGGSGSGLNAWGPRWMAGTSTVSRSRAIADAENFSLLVAHEQTYDGHISAMHAANPDLVVLTYINAAYAESGKWSTYPNSWFAHDRNGNKVKSTQFGSYVMDVSNPNWWNNRADKCKSLINDNGYDGCLLDLLGTGPLVAGQSTSMPYNSSTGQDWTYQQWLAQTAKLANRVESRVPNAVIYGNGLASGRRYFMNPGATSQLWDGPDGMMAEVFVRSAKDGANSFRGETQWKQDVDMLVDAANRNKTIFVTAKLWISASSSKTNQWHQYALGTFLLGADGDAFFMFSSDKSKPTDGHPWWDMNIGSPQGSYFKTSQGLYQRNYTNGRVLVNPTNSSKTISVGSGFRDVWGNPVPSTVTLQAHTARVLTKP